MRCLDYRSIEASQRSNERDQLKQPDIAAMKSHTQLQLVLIVLITLAS